MADTSTEVRGNVGFLIWRLSMRWRAAMDHVLAPLGLTQAQYAVLAPLGSMARGGTRPSQRELSELTGLDAVYISKLVRALERGGMVTRSPHPADPRAVELALTEHGAVILDKASELVYQLRDQLTRPLGGNEGTGTVELAAVLRQLLDEPAPGG